MMKLVGGLLVLFISLPIWLYLLYQILVRVNGSELMFFLFWIYVPVQIFIEICLQLIKDSK